MGTSNFLYNHKLDVIKGINRRLCALEQVLWERYEELISPWCERYQVFARFSNGETWYNRTAA